MSRLQEVDARIAWVREALAARSARGLLLRSRATFAWLTLGGLNHVVAGSEAGAVALLITPDDAVALAPVNEAARVADEELTGLPIEVRTVAWEDALAVDAEAHRLAAGVPIGEAELGDELILRRSLLGPSEHAAMRALASEMADALDAVTGDVRRGVSEHAIAGAVARELLSRGIRAPVLLVAADDRIARYRHPIPTRRAVQARLMIVVVAERAGLHVATTRIVELEPPSPDLERRAAATSHVLAEMRAATRPGATLGDVLQAARAAYLVTGFADEWRLHHQGGTIGYAPRERIATPGDALRLEAGMAVAWNPSVTGSKRESTMLVTDGDAEALVG